MTADPLTFFLSSALSPRPHLQGGMEQKTEKLASFRVLSSGQTAFKNFLSVTIFIIGSFLINKEIRKLPSFMNFLRTVFMAGCCILLNTFLDFFFFNNNDNKENFKNCHSQEEPKETHGITQCGFVQEISEQ